MATVTKSADGEGRRERGGEGTRPRVLQVGTGPGAAVLENGVGLLRDQKQDDLRTRQVHFRVLI